MLQVKDGKLNTKLEDNEATNDWEKKEKNDGQKIQQTGEE